MQPFIVIGILDSPWVVLAFLAGSALINWLTRRRAEKSRERGMGMPPAQSPRAEPVEPGPIDPDIERALRRLLGQDAPPVVRPASPPPPMPAPPPIQPRATVPMPTPVRVPGWGRGTVPSIPAWHEAEEGESEDEHPILAAEIVRRSERAPVEHATVHAQSDLGRRLRNPRTAREAWKLAVVLGPPVSLES